MSYTDVEVPAKVREAWKQAGFICWFDPLASTWRIAGSRESLRHFCEELRAHARSGEKHRRGRGHGPFPFINEGTRERPRISREGIFGTPDDILRLADLIERDLPRSVPGETQLIEWQYAENSPAKLVIEVREDDFDPATAPLLEQASGRHHAEAWPWPEPFEATRQ